MLNRAEKKRVCFKTESLIKTIVRLDQKIAFRSHFFAERRKLILKQDLSGLLLRVRVRMKRTGHFDLIVIMSQQDTSLV